MKERIIQESKKLIRLKGLQFTVADLVKNVRISKNTFYHHFQSKEEVILEIINEMKEESDQGQMGLINDQSIDCYTKLRRLLVVLPTDYDLINPITLHQLKTMYPKLYNELLGIYNRDWDRFRELYDACQKEGVVGELDIDFLRELYIVGLTHLPNVPQIGKYNHYDLLSKLVNQLFDGIPRLN